MRRAVFLDRDETLNRADSLPAPPPPAKAGDVVSPAMVELLPGAAEACRRLRDAGFVLVVYSNQGSVARGAIDLRMVEAINDRVRSLLPMDLIEAFYACPFHPSGKPGGPFTREHGWRKPGAGMITAAASELAIDLDTSWAVGDRVRDIEAAVAAGIDESRCLLIDPASSMPDLATAADRIIRQSSPVATQGVTMRLRALEGSPLADARTRATVIAAAGAIAERTGIVLSSVRADDRSITVTLEADRLTGLGFLAELRRNTNAWYTARHPSDTLWGDAPEA